MRCAQLRLIKFLKRSFPRNAPRLTAPVLCTSSTCSEPLQANRTGDDVYRLFFHRNLQSASSVNNQFDH